MGTSSPCPAADLCYCCRCVPLVAYYHRTKDKIGYCSREGLCKACAANYRAKGFTLKEHKEAK